jgi:hypothetical protein
LHEIVDEEVKGDIEIGICTAQVVIDHHGNYSAQTLPTYIDESTELIEINSKDTNIMCI